MVARNALLPLSYLDGQSNQQRRIVYEKPHDAVSVCDDASRILNGAIYDIHQLLAPLFQDGSKRTKGAIRGEAVGMFYLRRKRRRV